MKLLRFKNSLPPYSRNSKVLLTIVITGLIVFNFFVLMSAYPQTSQLDAGGMLAKDFSAYYTGVYRLWHNPSGLYMQGILNDGETIITPQPQDYKYLPSFLILASPLQLLSYHQAFVAFDIFQFALLPLIALLLYQLLHKKGLIVIGVVSAIVLLPFPLPHWGPLATYLWQWADGQAKVFETFLFLLSFYFGLKNKPLASGTTFALATFDPRFGLLALPLFLYYNKNSMVSAVKAGFAVLVISNLILLNPATGLGFLDMIFNRGLGTTLYAYAYIPLLTLIALNLVNFKEIIENFYAVLERARLKRSCEKLFEGNPKPPTQ